MKLTRPQMNELLDTLRQVNEENKNGTDAMKTTSLNGAVGLALMRTLENGHGAHNPQAWDIRDEWQATAWRYTI